MAGSGIVIEFKHPDEWSGQVSQKLGEDGFAATGGNDAGKTVWKETERIGLGPVDEVSVNPDGTLKYIRRLNGDQTHQGRHVRIGVDGFSILHVRLYRYE